MTEMSSTEAQVAPNLQPLRLEAVEVKPTTPPIELLPNELLSNIFGFLDSPSPSSSESTLHDEPHFDLTTSDNAPLKVASFVSKRWRRATIPLLFKHAQLVIKEDRKKGEPLIPREVAKPFLDFVWENRLQQAVQSFTFIVTHYAPILQASLKEEVEFEDAQASEFWDSIFESIDPKEVLIVAPADALGAFASCQVYREDMWSFDCPCHYLRLQLGTGWRPLLLPKDYVPPSKPAGLSQLSIVEPLPESSRETASSRVDLELLQLNSADIPPAQENSSGAPTSSPLRHNTTIFNVRPWTTILLNEGSFVRSFATYEFWNREAPSILPDLVGAGSRTPRISPTIRNMSYISIFPLQTHFVKLTSQFPRLNRLYVQIVPRNEILQNAKKMHNVEAEDLWMERNSCYALLMRELFNAPPVGNYKYLVEFESGDAADKDAWDMAVEYVKRAGNGWKVASEGTFVRERKDMADEEEEEKRSAFQGALMLWAFNGTMKLPVSPYPYYNGGMGP